MPDWLTQIPADFWDVLTEMAPFLLFGFLVAGLLASLVRPSLVERHLGGRGFWASLKAAAFGVPLPLCSCGVIPVSASLRRHGAGKGPTISFLISTPQTGVDSIFVTLSLMGGLFAVFRPVVALVGGVLGGSIVSAFERPAPAQGEVVEQRCEDACCAQGKQGRFLRGLIYGFDTLPRDIGKTLLIGLALAALITALVPEEHVAPVLGGGIGSMLIMMALGIPVYVCATASVPVAAALVAKGASPGVALVFLMTGPATNAATMATIWKVLGKRTAVAYLLTVAGTALGAGLLLDAIIGAGYVPVGHAGHGGLPWYVTWPSAVILLGVLGTALVRGRLLDRDIEAERQPEFQTTLDIKGMTCSHCADAVREALLNCAGVEDVRVNLAEGRAAVAGGSDNITRLRETVEELGYSVVQTQDQRGEE